MEPDLWDVAEVCRMLRTSPPNLRRLVAKKKFPKPIPVGQLRLWPARIVREWIAKPYAEGPEGMKHD
jgi:predicted DNA-binding transcriptional regulator AlpA